MTENSWIICYAANSAEGKPPYSFECTRCGATLIPSTPIALEAMAAYGNAFNKAHAKCKGNVESPFTNPSELCWVCKKNVIQYKSLMCCGECAK